MASLIYQAEGSEVNGSERVNGGGFGVNGGPVQVGW